MTLVCSAEILDTTITTLATRSAAGSESVALWLAANSDRSIVTNCYVPDYVARADMFQFTPQGMAELRKVLRDSRQFIAAQLHTHPFEAFHSTADDRWAVVRHVGALSIVLPRFARATTPENFFGEAAIFEMSHAGRWTQVGPAEMSSKLTFS